MRLQSIRQVAALWLATAIVFLSSAWASGVLLPSMPVTRPPASYYVGLVGLFAIGLALALTWEWVGRAGPSSVGARAAIRVVLALVGFVWVVAMIFPFL
ncbi:MAG TPA: hypothetical protein VFD67_07330 [Gemmatimonadaceae bacterium]|nr:hypothetical protein [Gemmatimonadaceae bacterium]